MPVRGKVAAVCDRARVGVETGGDGVVPLDRDDVRRLLGEIRAVWRINELLSRRVAAAGETIDIADAAATKVFRPSGFRRWGGSRKRSSAEYGDASGPRPPNCSTGSIRRPSEIW